MWAHAGPNEGGTLILHANTSITYSDGLSTYCGQANLDSTSAAVTSVPADPGVTTVFFALAAFPAGSAPRLTGIAFGIDYNPAELVLIASGTCADFELTTADWPGAGSGTALTVHQTRMEGLGELYWFAGYAYDSGTPTTFSLTPHPTQGGYFSDDSEPPVLDAIDGYGVLGFSAIGHVPLRPGSPAENPARSTCLMLYFGGADNTTSADEMRTYRPVQEVAGLSNAVRAALYAADARTARKVFPSATSADTLVTLPGQDPISLPDLSGILYVGFADSVSAQAVLANVADLPGVIAADTLAAGAPVFGLGPDDPYIESWTNGNESNIDAQWPLYNQNRRPSAFNCDSTDAAYDLNLKEVAEWVGSWDGSIYHTDPDPMYVMHVDVGVRNNHEDLTRLEHPPTPWSPYPSDVDICGLHGTMMAGLVAADVNNATGMAGVCQRCRILEFLSPDKDVPTCRQSACQSIGFDDQGCDRVGWDWCGYTVEYLDWLVHEGESPRERAPVLLVESGSAGPTLESIVATHVAHSVGTLVVAPNGEGELPNLPGARFPATLPYCLGVGGANQHGYFWTTKTGCTWQATQTGAYAGEHAVDVTGPATGEYLTLSPYGDETHSSYRMTGGYVSGAAALTAGVAGFIQSYVIGIGDYALAPDDLAGVIASSARPFAGDPTDPSLRDCDTCPRDYYGFGVLDVERAFRVLAIRSHWQRDVLTIEDFTEVGVRTYPGAPAGSYWREHKYTAQITVAPNMSLDPPMYSVWVSRGLLTTGYDRLLPAGSSADPKNVYAPLLGIHGAEVSVPDENGNVTITTYLFEEWESDWVWVGTQPEDLKVQVVTAPLAAEGVDEHALDDLSVVTPLRVSLRRTELVCVAGDHGRIEGAVFDVGGREVASYAAEVSRGVNFVPLTTRSGPLSRGVYFYRARGARGLETGKAVVLE